jgi:hypothetical protein
VRLILQGRDPWVGVVPFVVACPLLTGTATAATPAIHLGDDPFVNAHAGRTELNFSSSYVLQARAQ